MQVTKANEDGLKRELQVVIPQGELGVRFDRKLHDVKEQAQIKGFRKGKVPMAHLRKLYGRSIMSDVLQETIGQSSQQALDERKERPAFQPNIKWTEDKEEIERVMTGQADLAYTMSFEILPEIKLTDLSAVKLEKPVAEADEEQIAKVIDDLAARMTTFEDEAGRKAAEGDRVTIDFVGRIDGEAFEGGSGEGMPVVIGQGGMIPGFEDGLKGAAAGDDRTITATFPADYGAETLQGKEAKFDVKVKAVAKPKKPAIDDEFAKGMGMDSLAKLREAVAQQIQRDLDAVSRAKLKRALLDVLDKSHDFALPPTLVDGEFDGVWRQVTQRLEAAKKTFADEGKTEEQARADYRKLAERRVRLGLIIGDIGDKQGIKVTEEELRRALIEEARRYPGQEKFVYEYYQKNPTAFAGLRAPIYEDKVVDYMLELAKVETKKVSREELTKPEPDDEA